MCLVHDGASYQFSPETMSSRPSRLMSATAAVSLAPGSSIRVLNGMSGGRVMATDTIASMNTSELQRHISVFLLTERAERAGLYAEKVTAPDDGRAPRDRTTVSRRRYSERAPPTGAPSRVFRTPNEPSEREPRAELDAARAVASRRSAGRTCRVGQRTGRVVEHGARVDRRLSTGPC